MAGAIYRLGYSTRDMRWAIGALYIATGFLCNFVDMLLTGAMLGMTTPTYKWSDLVVPPLLSLGPALLTLSGAVTVVHDARRTTVCLITGVLTVGGLAAWTVPRIGWHDAIWLLLEPTAFSFLVAGIVVVLVKRRWIVAMTGSLLSAPFFLYGTAILIRGVLFGTVVLAPAEIWIVLPAILTIVSFVATLRMRTA
jgi:hypothetical protein